MYTIRSKPLHLAKSMADLRTQLDFRHNRNQPLTLKRLKEQYQETKKNATEYLEVENDQEQAYLAYYTKNLDLSRALTKKQVSRIFSYQDIIEQAVLTFQIVDESSNDESEESRQNTPTSSRTSLLHIPTMEREATLPRVLTPAIYRTRLLVGRRTPSPSRPMVRENVVLDESIVINGQLKKYGTAYKTFDECLAASRPSSSMWNRDGLRTPRELSAPSRSFALPPIRQEEQRTRECGVCLDEKPIADFGECFSAVCKHDRRQICTGCVCKAVQSAIGDGFATDVHCPELNCNASFDFDTIERLLVDFNASSDRPKTAVKALGHRLAMGYVDKMKNFVWCANGCGSGCQLVDGEGPMFTCLHCERKTCAHHRIKWHSGLTCAQYDRKLINDSEEQQNQKWLRDNAKKCPACHSFIQKNDGCVHMTCSHCKYEFCWVCFADFKPIQDYGNHNHVRHCIYYA
ncbi:unnamed protein product [Rotaria magnacalcarata]|uniref:RBR-type E3 ubiquitin transferase n=2 Tax=Rotaria magnacalcarata TaxID=392030 RepID=A0A819MLA5_9BILA|nr:unnamed protein product [Rotaria magnacalcarata]